MAALWLLLAACWVSSNQDDKDDDGAPWWVDCDDADPEVSPTAQERCDGVDQDCDGAIDEGEVAAADGGAAFFRDADGDGFGDDTQVAFACALLEDYAALSGDCDDDDAARHPGAEERCDDVDQDCDGVVDEEAVDPRDWHADADGDGYADPELSAQACEAPSGTIALGEPDCDDANSAVYPGAPIVCDDDALNDCDAEPGEEHRLCRFDGDIDVTLGGALDGVIALDAGDGSWHIGGTVALVEDLVGGVGDDLVLSAARLSEQDSADGCHAMLLSGSSSLPEDSAQDPRVTLRGPETVGPVQMELRADQDSDGDGLADVLVSCGLISRDFDPDDGQGLLLLIPGAELVSASGEELDVLSMAAEASPRALAVWGDRYDAGLGWGTVIAPALGTDAEGMDLLIGATWRDGFSGAVFRAPGDLRGDHVAGEGPIELLFAGPDTDLRAGNSIAARDVNGDGVTDLVVGGVGFRGTSEGGSLLGRAWLFADADPALSPFSTEQAIEVQGAMSGTDGIGDNFGQVVLLADLDGDGHDEWIITARQHVANRGAAFIVPTDALLRQHAAGDTLSVTSGDWPWVEGHASSGLGHSAVVAGDVDADGRQDLILGAPVEGGSEGAVYLVFGQDFTSGGVWDIDEVGLRLQGANQLDEDDYVGRSVAGQGDVDGDGSPDLLLGARHGYGSYDEGDATPAAYLILTGVGL